MTDLKEPIAAIEEEKFVLSAMQIRNGECIPLVASMLNPDDFYRPEHRIVYRLSLELYAEGTPPNALSLLDKLRKTNQIESVGYTFVYSLMECAHTTAYVEAYCKLIKEKANLRRIQLTAEKIAQDAANGKLSVDEIISAATTNLDAINKSTSQTRVISIHDFVGSEFDEIMKRRAVYAERKSGFDNLDNVQIWTPGVFGIGGTPGTGKTTFCQQLLEGFALNGEDCIYCSYEMSAEEIGLKSVARRLYNQDPFTRITASNMHENYDEERGNSANLSKILNARADVHDMNLTNFRVIELHDENTDKLLNLINRLSKGDKPPIVCIDYLQLLAAADGTENLKVSVDNTVRKLKIFQRDTGATIIAVSSLNRGNYAEQAALEAFKESGGLDYGFDAAWIMQMHVVNTFKGGEPVSQKREKISEAFKERPRKIHLKCLKNRRGALYDCYFNYYPASDYFEVWDDGNDSKSASNNDDEPRADDSYDFEETDDDDFRN